MSAFPLRMAWRETRAAWRHFVYFFVSIALGVGALVGVGLFATSLEEAVIREARALLGGDVEIRSSRALSPDGLAVLESLERRGIAWTHVSELVAMAAAANGATATTQIVELKAAPEAYPLYGHVVTEPERPLSGSLQEQDRPCARSPCWGALVQESLLIRMGLSLGDELKIGQARFRIAGLVRKEPDRVANAFSLGPRVLISRRALDATDLIQPGSRVHERYLLKVPTGSAPERILAELRGRLAGESVRIRSYRNAQPALKRFLDQLARYFGLIGLTALFVGGIGVATTVQAFLREKLHTIAVLKTLGADSRVVMRTYLLQALVLGFIGSVAGVCLGFGLQALLPSLANRLFPSPLLQQIDLTSGFGLDAVLAIVKGVALGLLTTLLFAIWPLLAVRGIRPALVFRREVSSDLALPGPAEAPGRRDWRRLTGFDDPPRAAIAAVLVVSLAGLAIWQAGSMTVGLLFIVALAVAVLLLSGAAWLIVRGLARLPAPKSLILRQAIRNIHRPGSQAPGVMVAIGIGVMVIVAVSLMEHSLIHHVGKSRPSDAPTFFFIDIQPDQLKPFVRLMHDEVGTAPEMTPLVRSRLFAIDGTPVALDDESRETRQDRRQGRTRWYFTREYKLTFLDSLPEDNTLIKGEWWPAGAASARPLVSVEEEAAEHLGVEIGSIVEFDIQGASVEATVASIRHVDWGSFSTNFYMILSPGSLDGAPFTYVGTIRVPPEQEVPLQQAVVAAFPNVTAINIGEVLDTFARILDRLSLAIRSVAVFCILAGAVVMATALATTRYRRLYESVILKALGSTRGMIAQAFAAEYAVLGVAAGTIGVGLAAALSWGLLYFFLDVPWLFQPDVLLGGLMWTVVLAVVVGVFSTFYMLGRRPLPVLRQE